MSNLEDYNSKLEAIKAIPNDAIQLPAIPVDVFLQESENLYHWSQDDVLKLNVVGITTDMINDLPVRTGACREAQSKWNKDFRSQKEAQQEWKEVSPEAYKLRDDLLDTMRFAYRKDDALLSRVSSIAEGSGHADLIQDLNDIAVMGKENSEPLTAIGFDLTLLDTAAAKSDGLADLLALANGDKAEQNESKVIRDKAYTCLKELVDEIRLAGKYVFRDDPNRYKGYTSSYWKRKKRSSADTGSEEAAE